MKIFVLGAGGMLGHKIYGRLKHRFDTWAVTRAKFAQYERFNIFDRSHFIENVDLGNETGLRDLLHRFQPDVLINCVGLTTRKIAPERESEVIRINALVPHILHDWTKKNRKRLIHFSTDCVFSGHGGPYAESACPDADDLYGRSKLLGEIHEAPSLTIRSSIVGRELLHHTELVEWLIGQRGKTIKGFSEVYYSGVTTNYMAYLVERILLHPTQISGLFHLASPRISKLELLCDINLALGLGVTIQADGGKRSDKSLTGNRLFEILQNVDKPLWPQMIRELAAEDKIYREWSLAPIKR